MTIGTIRSAAYHDVPYTRGGTVERSEVGALVRSAVDGDAAAWKAIVEGLGPLVWSVVRAHRLSDADAHEVYQTVWFRFTQHLDRLREPEKAGSWLASTARHECLKVHRHARRLVLTDDPQVLDTVSEEGEPEQALLETEEVAAQGAGAAAVAGVRGTGRAVQAVAARADHVAAAQLSGGVRRARHRGGQYRADAPALSAPAAGPAGGTGDGMSDGISGDGTDFDDGGTGFGDGPGVEDELLEEGLRQAASLLDPVPRHCSRARSTRSRCAIWRRGSPS